MPRDDVRLATTSRSTSPCGEPQQGEAPQGSPRYALAAIGALVLVAACLRGAVTAGDLGQGSWRLLAWIGAAWVSFAVGVWAVRRSPRRTAVALVVAGGVLLQLVAMTSLPRLTNDFFRYAWDGRVQVAGISPYRYAPVDPALASLRTDWLFSSSCAGAVPPCTAINHPTSATIYPPVAQAEFAAVRLVTAPLGPDGGRERTWQVLAALLATATTLLLVRHLSRHGDPRQAVLWAWCPTVALECGGNAHVDALPALLVVAALLVAAKAARSGAPDRARTAVLVTAGLLSGAAIAAKLLPVLLLPALAAPLPRLLRGARAGWRSWTATRGVLLLAAATTVVLTYLPHLLAAGTGVLGFLPGYLPEEGFDGSGRFPLLRPWLPQQVVVVVGAVILVAVALRVARRGDPARPWTGAMVMTAAAFAVLGITYPWYALLLVPLVALDGRGSWLAFAAAAYPGYLAPALHLPFGVTNGISYAAAVVLVTAVAWGRRAHGPAVTPSGGAVALAGGEGAGGRRSPDRRQ
jgi:hypothetical protein